MKIPEDVPEEEPDDEETDDEECPSGNVRLLAQTVEARDVRN
ncbi:hypothetical protein [Cryobacterium melibiosiphilum]|nr:hypothetical protein [Cryobacterium melibiosiphilum]